MLRTVISLGLFLGALGGISFPGVWGGAIPVYGTTRYGRPAWAYRSPAPIYARPPYPYPQSYPEELYYQPDPVLHYPYYPVARPYTKSDVYQTLYPYYYNDRLRPYNYYVGEGAYQPAEQLQDAGHEDAPRSGGRAEALPVGQETWFENEPTPRWQSEYDDVNAAFLQNLMMYNDALSKNEDSIPDHSQDQHSDSDYDDHRAQEYYGERDTRDFEDEDVRELKALAGKPLYHVPKTNVYSASGKPQNNRYQQQWHPVTTQMPTPRMDDPDQYNDDYPNDEGWINWGSKRSSEKKVLKPAKSVNLLKSTAAPATTAGPQTVRPGLGGQKEVVLLRPATPVRHPFPEPVMQMLAANSAQQKRNPSVYDTIKQLLSMDDSFKSNPNKARMQKRFVASEDDLVGELRGLKRRSPA